MDIVERLKRPVEYTVEGGGVVLVKQMKPTQDKLDAIAEIERLRAALRQIAYASFNFDDRAQFKRIAREALGPSSSHLDGVI